MINREPYATNMVEKTETEDPNIVIIGGGIAGLTCAKEIRNISDKAKVTVISSENHLPYYRVNLTRYLAKEADKSSLNIYPEEWYDSKEIKICPGKEVVEIDKNEKIVKLDDGSKVIYDKLIIATGAHAFIPSIPGSGLKNVITVRTIEDADFILREINKAETCICIGGGILGLETAGAIAKSGIKVLLLEAAQWLMPRQLNKKAALYLKKYLLGIGIDVKENVNIMEITGKECCEGVRLSSSEEFSSGIVIITAGIRPNTCLAAKANLEVGKGILVNNQMQTSDENIFAAGDVTEHNGKLYGLWNAAQLQGKIAAWSALGKNTEFTGIPSSTVLKVLGLDMFSIGEINPSDGNCCQYEKETADSYIAFVLRENRITGSIIIGDKALAFKVKQAVEAAMDFPHELYNDVDSIIEKLRSPKR